MTDLERYEPNSLVEVDDTCSAIERWAQSCDSVPELQDANNKLAAINEYLDRTSTEGRARVALAMRRLEARIGALLPSEQGRRTDQLPDRDQEVDLNDRQKSEFRQMAANPDVVEQVAAASTDEEPASRRKVMRAIKDKKREANQRGELSPEEQRGLDKAAAKPEMRRLAIQECVAKAIAAITNGVADLDGIDRDELLASIDDDERRSLAELTELLAAWSQRLNADLTPTAGNGLRIVKDSTA